MAVFGALLSLYLLISHQWGTLQHLFLFLSQAAHDTQPVFFGSDTPPILVAKFSGRTLEVVTQSLPSFQHERGKKKLIVFINSCCGDAPTQAGKRGMCNFCLWTSAAQIKSDSCRVRLGRSDTPQMVSPLYRLYTPPWCL